MTLPADVHSPAALGRAPGLVHRRWRDVVLVRDRAGTVHQLSGGPALVWEALDTPATADVIARRIEAQVPTARPVAVADVAVAERVLIGAALARTVRDGDRTGTEGPAADTVRPGGRAEAGATDAVHRMTGAADAVHRMAGWGLPGALPAEPVGTAGSAALVEGAIRLRLTGVLLAAVEAGATDLTAGDADRLARAHEQALRWALHLEGRLLDVSEALGAADVAHLVAKGPAVAHLDEPRPDARTFADLDLLVAPGRVDDAVAALTEMGGRRPWEQRRPGFDRRFAKSVTMTLPDGVQVDLHRTLSAGAPGARVDVPGLFVEPEPFALGGRRLAAPHRTHRVLHAAYHAVLGQARPDARVRRDVAVQMLHPAVEPDRVLAAARDWGGLGVLALATHDAAAGLGLDLPDWARDLDVSPQAGAEIARVRATGSGFGRASIDLTRALPRGTRVAYAYAGLVPSRAHLRSRGLRRRDLLHRRPRTGTGRRA